MAEHDHSEGAKIGMWLFILSEILLFGGLFLFYAVYRTKFSEEFLIASKELGVLQGTINTAILITSSFTMALSIHAMKRDDRKWTVGLLAITTVLATAFLVVKGFEWAEKFRHGLFPGSPILLEGPPGEILFFGLYFVMTGLHALHIIIGIGSIAVVIRMTLTGKVARERRPAVIENTGLYWHLVDIIWIFLFTLFYLIA